ncbi:DUF6907 domain-containing protein [Streptomyces antimycoticus]|uniref:DUF6907 domain-containing protein n=1 Tax=Streptomyces antimycoticus TaxID=68175 RepID=UPI0036EF0228|nr:hypothetical protein OG751_04205 [Streptomyces antimycoticus]
MTVPTMPAEASASAAAVTPTTPPPSASPRLVAAVVCGQRIALPCPQWCVIDHASENVINLDDFSHDGAPISLRVPVTGAAERVLIARLSQWPFASDEAGRAAYLRLEGTDDGEVANLPTSAALAFADQLVAHAEGIRALAGVLADA